MSGTAAVPCPVLHAGGLGAGVKVHFLAWLEFSLVYFLPFEFSKTEVRVRVSRGVMSMSPVADSLRPCPKTSFYSGSGGQGGGTFSAEIGTVPGKPG